MTKEALTLALEALEKALRYHGVMLLSDPPQNAWKYHRVEQTADEAIAAIKEALAQPEQEPESNAYDDQRNSMEQAFRKPEQEPVAWRYKPAREDNPRWEYTTNHPLDMGDGYIRPSLVEYCKCIEPLYAKEKPKLMLEKFREMEDLLEEPAQQEPATKEKIREAIVFNLPLYTTPPQRKPLTDEEIGAILEGVNAYGTRLYTFARAIEAKLKEKNT